PPESVQGEELIRRLYDPPGRVAPVEVVVDSERTLQVKDALASLHGVSTSNTDSQGKEGLVSLNVLLRLDPFSTDAMDLVPTLRETAHRAAGKYSVAVGGLTAQNYDNKQSLHTDALLIVPLVLSLILLVLILLLRCLVAPLYLI